MGWYWFDEGSDDEERINNNDASRKNPRRKQIASLALEVGDETKPKQDGTAQHVVAVANADQQPDYVQSQRIDDDNDDDNDHDAHQSEEDFDQLPACLAPLTKGLEPDKGSAPSEGVPNLNGLEGDSAFLEGELGERPFC
jgi:hypothetical protein